MKYKHVLDFTDIQTKIDIILISIERCRKTLTEHPNHSMSNTLDKMLEEEEENLCSMKNTYPDYFV